MTSGSWLDLNTLRALATVLCFAFFLVVVWWAFRRKNAQRFEEAANLPFTQDEKKGERDE